MARVTSNVETIGPDEAAKILEGCGKNRAVSQHTVDRYAKAMEDGKWALNGESVIVGRDGRLVDGQHRLWAVIQSGCTVDMLVVRGVDQESFETCDQGMNRTPTHALQAAGIEAARAIAPIMRWRAYYIATAGKTPTVGTHIHSKPDHGELIRAVKSHPGLESAAHWLYRMKRTNKMIPCGPFGAFAYLVAESGAVGDVDGFLEGFRDVEHALPDVREFHNHMLRSGPTRYRSVWGHVSVFGLLIKTHNAVVTGNPMRIFRMSQGDPFPHVAGLRGSAW